MRIQNDFTRCLGLLVVLASLPLQAAVVMPLEAIGANGTIAEGTVQVSAGSTAKKLWMQVHGLTYQEKASVQVNNGAWIALRNDNADMEVAYPDKGNGGVGGVFQTIRLTVKMPTGLVVNGANTVRIRFNQTDNVAISVRLLAFNFLDASGAKLVAASEFVQDNPATWTAPAGSASQADIDTGDTLWSSAALVNHPGGPSIQAKCSMCHDHEGVDLKYFNYSNVSIIERSKFHGLSLKQGEQIAAYIRSLPSIAPGRPWNPPYQPGPGLDAKPAAEWSAGAGLEWVLTDERDALPYLPGSGTSKSAYIDDNRTFKTFNYREVPQILQFLDWNRWLPVIHPIDSGSNWSISKNKTGYEKVRNGLLGLAGMTKDQYIRGPMRQDIDDWSGPETHIGGVNLTTAVGQATHTATSSVRQNNAILMWGLTQEFGLHDLGEQLYGSQGEKRMFFSDRMIFNLAPHILRGGDDDLRLVVDSTHNQRLDWDGVTDSWYRMQTILNGGQRNSFTGGHHDVDWKYNWYFGGQSNGGNGFFPIIGLGLSWKSIQEIDGGYGPEGADKPGDLGANSWFGFNLRDGRPELGHLTGRNWGANWTSADKVSLLSPMYAAWVEKLAMFPVESWDKVKTPEFNKERNYTWGSSGSDESYPDFLKDEITALKNFGVADAITTGLADHGKYIWSQNDWASLKPARSNTVAAPTGVVATSGAGRITVSWNGVSGATSYNLMRADAVDGIFQSVSLQVSGTSTVDNLLLPGKTYWYRVTANKDRALSNDSATVSATVSSGLVLYWSFEESAGNQINDASGGTVWGKRISSPATIAGKVGNAVELNGQSSYASNSFLSSSQNLNRWTGRSVTLSAWVKTTAVGTNNDATRPGLMGTYRDKQTSGEMYLGGLNEAGKLTAKYWGGSTVVSTKVINDGVWHHVAITRDEGTGVVSFYVDGVAAGSGTSASGFKLCRMFGIGRVDVTGTPGWAEIYRYWPGAIDEVRLYNQVLNAAAVQAIFDEEKNGVPGTGTTTGSGTTAGGTTAGGTTAGGTTAGGTTAGGTTTGGTTSGSTTATGTTSGSTTATGTTSGSTTATGSTSGSTTATSTTSGTTTATATTGTPPADAGIEASDGGGGGCGLGAGLALLAAATWIAGLRRQAFRS